MKTYRDNQTTVLFTDAITGLRSLEEKSIHACVCSPPYFGLRSYLDADHADKTREMGAEPTLKAYIENLCRVFDEVWRVLRDDSTLWLNLGDGYVNKQLQLVPHRVAIALQERGWYLRSAITWTKLNPMPESVRDRPTSSYEMVFMLAKRPRYFYDATAVREPHTDNTVHSPRGRGTQGYSSASAAAGRRPQRDSHGGLGKHPDGRNQRNVWNINPRPYAAAHFATYPVELPLRCIKAGTSEHGVCGECGAPYERVIGETYPVEGRGAGNGFKRDHRLSVGGRGDETHWTPKGRDTVGWKPTCTHDAPVVPATVLDPFLGSGTTALGAKKLGRRAVGIELDERCERLVQNRLGQESFLFGEVGA